MLGDFVAAVIRFGIPEDKFKAFCERHGVLPECAKCQARRKWLNEFGQEFGHGAKKLLKFFLRN